MTTFDQLLREVGIAPEEVALLRHQTERGGKTPAWLWENRRQDFLLYQSTQQDRPIFRRRYWAAFISPAKHETVFVGLFSAKADMSVPITWPDPLDGGPVGAEKPGRYQYFRTELLPQLDDQIGKLQIDWGDAQRQWTQKGEGTPKRILTTIPKRRPNLASALEKTLELIGFSTAHRTQKVTLMGRDRLFIYLKNETSRFPIVINPLFDRVADQLLNLPGVTRDPERPFYINSNLSAFPVYRSPDRVTASRYGIALQVDDSASVARLADLLHQQRQIDTPEGRVEVGGFDGQSTPTEKERLALARIGQGDFRLGCDLHWGGKCALTGLGLRELLRASHIRPWSEATERERLDPFNGLLLAAHVDALFDKHLISFADDGALICSPRVDLDVMRLLGISREARIAGLDKRHASYLASHRLRLVRT